MLSIGLRPQKRFQVSRRSLREGFRPPIVVVVVIVVFVEIGSGTDIDHD